MLRILWKIHHLKGYIRAASRGPKPLSKRLAQRVAHKLVYKMFR